METEKPKRYPRELPAVAEVKKAEQFIRQIQANGILDQDLENLAGMMMSWQDASEFTQKFDRKLHLNIDVIGIGLPTAVILPMAFLISEPQTQVNLHFAGGFFVIGLALVISGTRAFHRNNLQKIAATESETAIKNDLIQVLADNGLQDTVQEFGLTRTIHTILALDALNHDNSEKPKKLEAEEEDEETLVNIKGLDSYNLSS